MNKNVKMTNPMTMAMPTITFLQGFSTVSSVFPLCAKISTVNEVVTAFNVEPAAR